MRKKRYKVVNEERWENFLNLLGIAVIILVWALIEHFLGPCYR